MNQESKLKSVLWNLDTIVASVVLAILIILTFAGVPFRYLLGAPFTWLEEVQLACMVWIVYAGAGVAFRAGNQVAIEMIVDLMPKGMQKMMEIFISIVVVVVLGYLFYQSLGYIGIFLRSGRATPMLKIPYALIYGIGPVSFVLMVISYFYALFKGVKSEAKEAVEQ